MARNVSIFHRNEPKTADLGSKRSIFVDYYTSKISCFGPKIEHFGQLLANYAIKSSKNSHFMAILWILWPHFMDIGPQKIARNPVFFYKNEEKHRKIICFWLKIVENTPKSIKNGTFFIDIRSTRNLRNFHEIS